MFNVITGKDFEHTFEEIMSLKEKRSKKTLSKDEVEQAIAFWRKLWDYYNEAKNEEELRAFHWPDARTKLGKIARKLRDELGIDQAHLYEAKYKSMCREDVRLSNENE